MPITYRPIATQTLGSAAGTVTFSSIPATYTDLVVVSNYQTNAGAVTTLQMKFNSDTTANYSYTRFYGDGSSGASSRAVRTDNIAGIGIIDSSAYMTNIAQINNYTNTNTLKTTLSRTNSSGTYLGAYMMMWNSTTAITSLALNILSGSSFSTGSTFTLYGIKAA